jgi:hypothetical protein
MTLRPGWRTWPPSRRVTVSRGTRELEDLLQEIRAAANVSTHTTIVLSTPFENRPPRI